MWISFIFCSIDPNADYRTMSAEMPPPLPPRRRFLNHVYTTIDLSAVDSPGKTRKSTWNLKNMFGRTKPTKSGDVVKSQTSSTISNLCANDDCQLNLLTNSKNSFSTPDLTNIAACSSSLATPPISPNEPCVKTTELDETDLDIMDIERSNSLNCATNQFTCRPPPLNISDNILWSHNLSLTLSSSAVDSSAINLVGANVNGHDSILGRDMSGYCQMAPILNKTNQHHLVRTSTKNFDDQSPKSSLSLDASTIYCTMAPIMPKTDVPAQPNQDHIEQNPMKNITFERTCDFNEDHLYTQDCLMKSVEHSNEADLSDITSSSGVSSYDGASVNAVNSRCVTPADVTTTTTATTGTILAPATTTIGSPAIATIHDHRNSDDAISLTYTESPPQSAQVNQYFTESPFIYNSSKFDEKTPSYFPNEIASKRRQHIKTSINTVQLHMRTTKQFHMTNATDASSNGLIRSWARFRKIDFSPLKIRINSFWQRPNQEY